MAKVLVVDDEPLYLTLLKPLLQEDGHEVATAETGENAIEIGRETLPDVLLTDWRLKNRSNGLDIARKLRAKNARMGIIIMTGYSATELGHDADDLERLQVLRKPFDGDTVRRMVREAAGLAETTMP